MTNQNEAIAINLEILLGAVLAHPEKTFNLDYFKKDEPCGTLFCTVGLACTLPYFRALGLSLVRSEYNRTDFIAMIKDERVNAYTGTAVENLNAVFGEQAWARLFRPSVDGMWDYELGTIDSEGDVTDMTDKALAVARLRKQLAIYQGASDVVEA